MKRIQVVVWILTAALLSACTMQDLAPAETAVPSTASLILTLPPSTAIPTRTPRPTPTPTVAISFLCPPASSSGEWQCQENANRLTRTCTPASSSEPGWMCYEDLKYGFALAFPSNWRASVPINEDSSDGVTIIRRHSFMGPQGALDLDIWPASEPDLKTWLEEQNKVADLSPVVEPNARVAGYPAVVFVGDPTTISPMFSIFVSNRTYGYRLWFTLQCDEEEVVIMHRIVDSFRFSAESVPAEIPDAVWQEVQRAFKPPRCAGNE